MKPTNSEIKSAITAARERMKRHQPGSDQWWVAYYDLRKAESLWT